MQEDQDPDLFAGEMMRDVLFLDATGKHVEDTHRILTSLNVRTGEGTHYVSNGGPIYFLTTETFTVPAPCKVFRDTRHVCRPEPKRTEKTWLDRLHSFLAGGQE